MKHFIADTHFEHEAVVRMMARIKCHGQLFSMEEHDAHLIDQINARVSRDDELIIGGDFALHNPGKYRMRINCKHIRFVLGNHDSEAKCRNVFGGEVHEHLRVKAYNADRTDHVKLFISHYPNAFWDGSHRGWAHLYGHVHGQREEILDWLFPQRRAVDFGVDNIYRITGEWRPWSEVEIFDYMARREGHDDLRHYLDYQAGLYMERGLLL